MGLSLRPEEERGAVACPLCGTALSCKNYPTRGNGWRTIQSSGRRSADQHLRTCEPTLSPRERSLLADLAADHIHVFQADLSGVILPTGPESLLQLILKWEREFGAPKGLPHK